MKRPARKTAKRDPLRVTGTEVRALFDAALWCRQHADCFDQKYAYERAVHSRLLRASERYIARAREIRDYLRAAKRECGAS